MAELSRPFPPGTYPLLVVGSGPGGLQLTYFLRRWGVPHAVISADEEPGGMFRRLPLFERLITWSKRHPPVSPEARSYEWYDWNTLLAEEMSHRALLPEFMDGTSIFPSRSEMEQALVAFAARTEVQIRYGCRWEATHRREQGFTLETSDGSYHVRVAVFAVGMAEPWKPQIPGIEAVPHYVETRPAHEYAGKRVFIVGKRNSAFELADAFHPWARQIILASPRPAVLSLYNRSASASVRARYAVPYEDHLLGGGTFALDASIERIERHALGWRVSVTGTAVPGTLTLEADDVIAATGFSTPLRDLRACGVRTFSHGRIPYLTPFWESVTVPGMYFGGAVSMGAVGLRKFGLSSLSAGVSGFRHNMRVLAEHLARTYFNAGPPLRELRPDEVVPFLIAELNGAPELWNQRAYLARAVSVRPDGRLVDEGVQPLQHFVDGRGPDAVAVTVETDDRGEHRSALYVRQGGSVTETVLPAGPLLDFDTPDHRARLADLLKVLLPSGVL
ncbi:MAG: NAD(P)-binding domain-containing protein [bacterium]